MEGLAGSPTGKTAGNSTEKMAGNPAGKLIENLTSKDLEMAAGRVLIAQASRQAMEEREKLEEERQGERGKEREKELRDAPQLSEQSKWFGIEGRLLKEASLAWVLEMEKELWDAFLAWMPSSDRTIYGDLEELSRLYLALLEKIFMYTEGENLAIQTGRLEDVLVEKIHLLGEFRVQHLTQLLAQNGQTDALKYVWKNLYLRVAGEYPSGKQAEKLLAWSQGLAVEKKEGFAAAGSRPDSSEVGRLYRPSGKGEVEVHSGFDEERRSGELQISRRMDTLKEMQGKGADKGGREAFLEDLMRAEGLAKHLTESESLFQSLGHAGGNQEAAGYFAAITFIKGQIYVADARSKSEIDSYLERLVSQMADVYLGSKGARQVYYHTTDIYARTKDFQKASQEGLAHAYRLFREKKGEAAYQKKEAYSERAGFFRMLSGRTLEEDFQRGICLLEKNWKSFLALVGGNGEQDSERAFRAQRYSPWGMMMERVELEKEQDRRAERMFLRVAFLLAAAGIVFLCWKGL